MRPDIDLSALRAFLDGSEDCSPVAPNEYIIDLYDAPRPLTLDVILSDKGVNVTAAALLVYDEEQDGWYMDERIDDETEIFAALKAAIGQNG